jgi:predicted secreted hydrolase
MRIKLMNILLPLLALLTMAGLLSACQPSEKVREPQLAALLGAPGTDKADGAGFAAALPGARLRFPADHLAHYDFRQEWWYLTANLTTARGEALGLQWTQFRVALAPPSPQMQASGNTGWQSSQLYFAHGALTSAKGHEASEKWSRGHPQLAGVQASPLAIFLDDWRWQSEGDSLFPARLTVQTQDFGYDLRLSSSAPLQLQGDAGHSIKSQDATVASRYYSQPFIDIQGDVTRNGERETVSGTAWLDREWSSQFLGRQQQGWDWFALRLSDGSALMLYRLRGKPGEPDFISGRRMYRDGSGHNLAVSTGEPIEMQPLAWQQTINGRYPVRWRLVIPNEQLTLEITPLNPDSAMPLSIPYWEGPVRVRGSLDGQGYMELTGY